VASTLVMVALRLVVALSFVMAGGLAAAMRLGAGRDLMRVRRSN